MPQIELLDGKKISFVKSINGFELTKKISKSLEKLALIMEVDGELKDLSHQIIKDSKVRIITMKDFKVVGETINNHNYEEMSSSIMGNIHE